MTSEMNSYSPLHKTIVNFLLFATLVISTAHGEDRGLIGHWKLAGDVKDSSGHGNDGKNHGVDLTAADRNGRASGAARFNGTDAFIEVPSSKSLRLGTGDFTLTAWVHTTRELDDVVGD